MDLFSAAKIHSELFQSHSITVFRTHTFGYNVFVDRRGRRKVRNGISETIERSRDKIVNSKMENGEQSADWRVLYNRELESDRDESALHIREMTRSAISCKCRC